MSSLPASSPLRSAPPVRAIAQLSSTAIAVLVFTPWGSPHQAAPYACVSPCMPYAQSMVLGLAFELDDAGPLPVLAPPTGTPIQQPLPATVFAASATLQDTLIASRMGGRVGP